MKHRDRVLQALSHEKPDRCPMQISFTPEFADRLRSRLALVEKDKHHPHGAGNSHELERTIGEDLLLTSVGWANSYYANTKYADGAPEYRDEWGVSWKNVEYETPFGKGFYTEIAEHPLTRDEAILTYTPPDPLRADLYHDAEWTIRNFKSEYWIVGMVVTTIFETAWALRGFEQTLVDMTVDLDYANELFDIPFQYHFAAAKKLTEMGVDMIWLGDDVGGQERMIVSPVMWRRLLKPRMAELIAGLKEINPGIRVAYHSDGTILPIIDDLIEIGVDVLNPIQPRCMDPAALKSRFGDRLSFWGTLDIQGTLPFGNPEEVRREVKERVLQVGGNGGLIIGPTHHVQLDTPMENFDAMVDAILTT